MFVGMFAECTFAGARGNRMPLIVVREIVLDELAAFREVAICG